MTTARRAFRMTSAGPTTMVCARSLLPRGMTHCLTVAVAVLGVWLHVLRVGAESLPTRWTADVSANHVWTEYPRPHLARPHWLNLNGLWDVAVTPADRTPPEQFSEKILVPFPIESQLSGLARRLAEDEVIWYKRRFTVPERWHGQRIILNFGAVDWEATVQVNGRHIGSHRGGYDSFAFDLTDVLRWDMENELIVAVKDPTEGDQPRGKQSRRPEGIFYLPSSGIWQTVWLEPVPPNGIRKLYLSPDLGARQLGVRAIVNGDSVDSQVQIIARLDGQEVGRANGMPDLELIVPLETARPWTPDTPVLYDLEVTLLDGGQELDQVTSYFGLREIRVGKDEDGLQRIFLNGEPLFQIGVLDQGFWPDGLYTAPSDDAMRFDLETAKRLGFNLVRKHVKVEPARWYYWADRLGLLIWQDMPSGNNATTEGRRQFEMELHRMMEQLDVHPSIIMWVLFNEGWGQFDTERLVRRMKVIDPTRLVNNASGWTDAKVGDVIDLHSYPEPIAPATETLRATVLGEFGGLELAVEDHKWSDRTWGYQWVEDPQTLTSEYWRLAERVWALQTRSGLSAAVYTQLTDVETECNGFLTYDRAVMKVDASQVRSANQGQPQAINSRVAMPSARQGAYSWRFTTTQPAEDWMGPEFDASAWRLGIGGFGTVGTPGAIVNTVWDTSDIWLRREFVLPDPVPSPLALVLHHDEDVDVYLNGVLAARLDGFAMGYQTIQLNEQAQEVLRPGGNCMAIHCRQSGGGQYIDAGLRAEDVEE